MSSPITKRLNTFVLEKMQEPVITPLHRPPFGFGHQGTVIGSRQMTMHSLQFLYRYRGVTDFGHDYPESIDVPRTETGVAPSCEHDLPFCWTGLINEYVATMAVWWAFDLLTESEVKNFLVQHHPIVIFRYMEHRLLAELKTRFDGTDWILM